MQKAREIQATETKPDKTGYVSKPNDFDMIYRNASLDQLMIWGLTESGRFDEAERELAAADGRVSGWRLAYEKPPYVQSKESMTHLLDKHTAKLDKLRAELIKAH